MPVSLAEQLQAARVYDLEQPRFHGRIVDGRFLAWVGLQVPELVPGNIAIFARVVLRHLAPRRDLVERQVVGVAEVAPHLDAVSIVERVERVLRCGGRPEIDRGAGAVAQLEVSRDEVCVQMGEKHVRDPKAVLDLMSASLDSLNELVKQFVV